MRWRLLVLRLCVSLRRIGRLSVPLWRVLRIALWRISRLSVPLWSRLCSCHSVLYAPSLQVHYIFSFPLRVYPFASSYVEADEHHLSFVEVIQ